MVPLSSFQAMCIVPYQGVVYQKNPLSSIDNSRLYTTVADLHLLLTRWGGDG